MCYNRVAAGDDQANGDDIECIAADDEHDEDDDDTESDVHKKSGS